MRLKNCQITDTQEIERILSSTDIGRLASIGADGYPYITPVNFVCSDGNVYFHSAAKGEKLDNLKRDSKVCFEVDVPLAYVDAGFDPDRRIGKLGRLYHCVIIRGEARVLPDGPLKVATLNALIAKCEIGSDHELVNEDMPCYKSCKVVEIKPMSVSGKSQLWQSKRPEERLALAQYLINRAQPGDLNAVRAMGFDPKDL